MCILETRVNLKYPNSSHNDWVAMMEIPGKFIRIIFQTTFLGNTSIKNPSTDNSIQTDVNFNKPVEIGLFAPEICPFCDSMVVSNQIKIFNDAGSHSYLKFITIWVCEKHSKYRPLNATKFCSILIILCSIGFLSIFISVILSQICMIITMVYFLASIIRNLQKQDRGRKMFKFEFFPSRSVIHTTSHEWTNSFARLNPGTTVLENVNPFTPKIVQFNKWTLRSFVLFVASFVLSLISISPFHNEILRWLFEIISIAAILIFICLLMYTTRVSIPKARYEFYFKPQV